MHQNRPGHGQLTMRKAFGAHPPPEKHVLEDADAPFGLRPAPLHALELPRTVPLPELLGRTGTDRVEDLLFFEAEAVEFAIEPPVARERFGARRAGLLHARHTARQQG